MLLGAGFEIPKTHVIASVLYLLPACRSRCELSVVPGTMLLPFNPLKLNVYFYKLPLPRSFFIEVEK